MIKRTLLCLLLLIAIIPISNLQAQCAPGESEVQVTILTDNWGYETSWEVAGSDGTIYYNVAPNTYDSDDSITTIFCVPNDACIVFNIYDSYGDGIYAPGGYTLLVDGVLIGANDGFGDHAFHFFNCPEGAVCSNPIPITEGDYTTLYDDTWYTFIADSVGTYLISTCGNNDCDTKIWVYDNCFEVSESNEGTIFYNDNNDDCDLLAEVSGYFNVGTTYYIRIGSAEGDCDGTPIDFSVIYAGPVIGCTDPTSCNFNPLATVDDGTCIPQGDPECPEGPDLVLRQDVLESSIYLTTLEVTDECLVNEGCIQGFGLRDVVRFTTHIENNGTQDYLIGDPNEFPGQFTYDNCHGHFHYDGYAEYVLYDSDGNLIPVGFKNGFCVLDLVCENGGTAQYGCGYMGITAGCGDIYGSGLSCQWIDVTDVPDGIYTFVTRVNWDNAPDALGRIEMDIENNWGQVCIRLDRTTGVLVMTLPELCPIYVDCAGTPFGSAQEDCTGECGGTTLMGDLDNNTLQEMVDAQDYVDLILTHDITPTPCNDLNADDQISVYDAALLSGCLNYGIGHQHAGGGSHDHCSFPDGVVNIFDTTTLSIVGFNATDQYIDIAILNPTVSVVAYQFQVSGVNLVSAENLVDPNLYPITPKVSLTDGMVIGISYQDSTVLKENTPQNLVRLHYQSLSDTLVCISNIVDIINQDYQQTITRVDGPCLMTVSNKNLVLEAKVKVKPNPFSDQTRVSFYNPSGKTFTAVLMNTAGQIVRRYEQGGNALTIQRGDLASGVYFFRVLADGGEATGRIVIE